MRAGLDGVSGLVQELADVAEPLVDHLGPDAEQGGPMIAAVTAGWLMTNAMASSMSVIPASSARLATDLEVAAGFTAWLWEHLGTSRAVPGSPARKERRAGVARPGPSSAGKFMHGMSGHGLILKP